MSPYANVHMNWTIRKWNDGTAECWGTLYYDEVNITATVGFAGNTVYISTTEIHGYFPDELFVDAPICIGNLYRAYTYDQDSGSYTDYALFPYIASGAEGTNTETPAMRLMRIGGSVSGLTVLIKYHAIGKWK